MSLATAEVEQLSAENGKLAMELSAAREAIAEVRGLAKATLGLRADLFDMNARNTLRLILRAAATALEPEPPKNANQG